MNFRWSRVIALVFLVAVGCKTTSKDDSAGDASTQDGTETTVKAIEQATGTGQNQGLPGASKDPGKADACLIGFAGKLDSVLTMEAAAKVAGRSASEGQEEYKRPLKDQAFHELSFTWPSPRKRKIKVGTMVIDAPVSDEVTVGSFQPMDPEYFRRSYRPVTERERAQFDERIDKSDDLKSESDKEVAKGLGGVISDIAKAYRQVEGVGDVASFNSIENRLYVNARGVTFKVTVDLSDDSQENEKKAIELARGILARCP